jgi:transcriptional regulator with XRE-family HTH domain
MVGERVCRLRTRLALTTAELADLLEVSPRVVERWEAGKEARGPGGPALLVLRALEGACARDPSFAIRLRQWVPFGQCYLLRRLVDAA